MDLNNALDQLNQWATRQQAILDLADALRGVGSVEQLAGEAGAKLEVVNNQLADANSKLTDELARLDAARDEANRVHAEAQSRAEGIVAQAQSDADAIVAKAREAAGTRLAETEVLCHDQVAKATAVSTALQHAADAVQAKAEQVAAKILQDQVVLEGIEAKIAAAQTQIAKMLA
jgi:hypothetical protein